MSEPKLGFAVSLYRSQRCLGISSWRKYMYHSNKTNRLTCSAWDSNELQSLWETVGSAACPPFQRHFGSCLILVSFFNWMNMNVGIGNYKTITNIHIALQNIYTTIWIQVAVMYSYDTRDAWRPLVSNL